MKFFKYIVIILVFALVIFLFIFNGDESTVFKNLTNNNSSELKMTCENAGGDYLAKYDECEYVNENECSEMGGTYEGCESYCRHDKDFPDVFCIEKCVSVCTFE